MLTSTEAKQFAEHWIHSWNSHNLDAILSHYCPDVVLTSPAVAQLLKESSGTLKGRDALGRYFARGLEAYPNLTFVLHDVLCGLNSVLLYYTNQKGTKTGEYMELDGGKVVRVVANYSA
jgi:ketosteroid isomerase-like protein